MGDKVKDLEDRIDKLENRLKVTFLEVEKRLESFKQEQPMSMDDRLQELEDLLLLIQLEVTKLKDRSGSLDFGVGAMGPDVNERLNKIEEALLGEKATVSMDESPNINLEDRVKTVEERVEHYNREPFVEGRGNIVDKLDDIEDRLNIIEGRVKSNKDNQMSHNDVLEDVRKILSS